MDQGENVALTGATGCGKTSLLSLICGLQRPATGEILLRGKSVAQMSLPEVGSIIGYVRQNPERQLYMPTVLEELMFSLIYRGEDRTSAARAAEDAMDCFAISHLRDRPPCLLSRGEKQRVCLAASLLLSPSFYVMDEPTAALDPLMRARVADVFRKQSKQGRGVLMVTHDSKFAAACCNRLLELRDETLHEIQI